VAYSFLLGNIGLNQDVRAAVLLHLVHRAVAPVSQLSLDGARAKVDRDDGAF
jgi:hypothetical protein